MTTTMTTMTTMMTMTTMTTTEGGFARGRFVV